MKYVWDENKNISNKKQHKISFKQAEEFLIAGNYEIKFDQDHSTEDEDRFLAIGPLNWYFNLVVVFVEIIENELTRIISARKEPRKCPT